MQITTKNIIKALPIGESFKTELLNEFDVLPADQKYAITQLMWGTFQEMLKLKIEENMQKALKDVTEEKERLDKVLYHRVRQQSLRELESDLEKGMTNTDLSAARTAMEKIIAEIRASKKK